MRLLREALPFAAASERCAALGGRMLQLAQRDPLTQVLGRMVERTFGGRENFCLYRLS